MARRPEGCCESTQVSTQHDGRLARVAIGSDDLADVEKEVS